MAGTVLNEQDITLYVTPALMVAGPVASPTTAQKLLVLQKVAASPNPTASHTVASSTDEQVKTTILNALKQKSSIVTENDFVIYVKAGNTPGC
jgi:predicted alpha/beta hydrolase family esterase